MSALWPACLASAGLLLVLLSRARVPTDPLVQLSIVVVALVVLTWFVAAVVARAF